MFRLIGIVVVVAVLVIGFNPLKKLYFGEATPHEAVGEIRHAVGQSVVGGVESANVTSDENPEGQVPNDFSQKPLLLSDPNQAMPLNAQERLENLRKKK